MLDKFVDLHKNPWTQVFHLIGFIVLVYGLWNQNWIWILGAIVIALIGHSFNIKVKRADKGGSRRKKR